MRTLSRPPTVVVLMGVSGSGKTTVGQALAAGLGVHFHDADAYHSADAVARMRAGHPLTDDDRWPWLERLAAVIAETLARGDSAVLACSALRRVYRERLAPPGTPPQAVPFIHLEVGRAELARRLAHRAAHYMPASLLDSQLATLEEPEPDESALTVNAEQPVEKIVDTILATLGA